ncbi:AGCS family alanine or glycine:cation symporter [Clostridium pascui]|uniref:alanine/glycine:cation symporter family protein n=1 Tax=Clostridium pascui TaxID=46609 RepID=UPI001959A17D|nr:sodium:alanine symporter family protein [Clostridium pascui]MBM7870268.1 AGCS family alanine or glycine:cation symporter [Clostridium pascui]
MGIIKSLNGIFWGWLVAGILLSTGVFYTILLKFPQVRHFKQLFTNIIDGMKKKDGVSGFGALCAAVGGQVGTGSLVGVATALASGGPGAIFWMWVTAILGMPINFGEAVLGQIFRVKNKDGTFRGGPAYYMEKGFKSKLLATLFSISLILGIGFNYVMIQSNSISNAVTGVIDINPAFAGIALVILVSMVIFGGVKRLAGFSSYVVPFMALVYILIAVFIVITNFNMLLSVFALIFKSAFNFNAAAGGVAGYTIKEAFRFGVARGLFSNDAGNGTTPSMHASANVKHPVNQGFAAMLGVFLTTMIVCSCTAFVILFTGALDTGATGIALTQAAFGRGIPFGNMVVFAAMFLFGFTTLLADIYYGEVNLRWLFPKIGDKLITPYRILSCGVILVGAIAPVTSLWELADFFGALMVFFNVIALIGLSKHVKRVYMDYKDQKKNGIEEPVWDYEDFIKESEETTRSHEKNIKG